MYLSWTVASALGDGINPRLGTWALWEVGMCIKSLLILYDFVTQPLTHLWHEGDWGFKKRRTKNCRSQWGPSCMPLPCRRHYYLGLMGRVLGDSRLEKKPCSSVSSWHQIDLHHQKFWQEHGLLCSAQNETMIWLRCYNGSRIIHGGVVDNCPIEWQVRGHKTPYRKRQSHVWAICVQSCWISDPRQGAKVHISYQSRHGLQVLPVSLSL